MGNNSSFVFRSRHTQGKCEPNDKDSNILFSTLTLNGRARNQLCENAPELVPYFETILRVVTLPDDFYIPRSLTRLDDCLYLGDINDARDLDQLKHHNITNIINTAESSFEDDENYTKSLYDSAFKYMGFPGQDREDYPIMSHFKEIHSFIENARKNNEKCLIHCMRGVNRSGVLAVAHIMVKNNLGPITASQLVYQKRGMLLTNPSFISQLLIYAQQNGYTELDKDDVLLP